MSRREGGGSGSTRSIGILTGLNLVGAVVRLASSVVIARLFGTSMEVAVYFGASTLLGMVVSLTQTGQLVEVLMPVYHQRKEEAGLESAHRAFAVVFNWLALATAGLSVVLALLSPVLVRLLLPGFEEPAQELGTRVFLYLVPLVGFQALGSLMHMLANAESQFGKPESFSVAGNVAAVVAILVLAPSLGVWALVISLWTNSLFYFLGLTWVLWNIRYRHRAVLKEPGFDHGAVFKQLLHTLWYLGATQIYGFVLNAALSMTTVDIFAVFKYVQAVYSKTNAVLLRPISTVFFTRFSESVKEGAAAVGTMGRRALRQSLGISALAVVAMWTAGYPLLDGLWGGEKFGEEQLRLAHFLLTWWFVLFLFAALGGIARKVTVALGMVRSQYGGMAAVQLLSAPLAWILIDRFSVWGIVVVLGFNFIGRGLVPVALMAFFHRFTLFYPWRPLAKWILAAAAGIGAGLLTSNTLSAYAGLLPEPVGDLLLAVVIASFACATTLVVAWITGVEDMRIFLERLRDWLRDVGVASAPGRR